jgi:hypothetical protein
VSRYENKLFNAVSFAIELGIEPDKRFELAANKDSAASCSIELSIEPVILSALTQKLFSAAIFPT